MSEQLPCLIVGAGPTGLSLAAQLAGFGTPFRIVDRSLDRAHESRALAIQARTLEVLDSLGLGDTLVALGNPGTRVVIHFEARPVASATLGDVGAKDTRYPFILFLSQAETERVLADHLEQTGISIERGVELVQFDTTQEHVECLLRHPGGRDERLRVRYLVGCDGAHSSVRSGAGFSFEGGSYPEDFALGDVAADGPLVAGAINAFVGGGGAAMFFPLGSPTPWRVIAMRAPAVRAHSGESDRNLASPLALEELQALIAAPTADSVTVRDPAWLSRFHLHHRQIAHYRQGRVFLAGDAAHIHSPVGAQGMNTGIQDAWNLGWKLALVLRGAASETLLDSYEAERWPVGRSLLRTTDRLFATFTRSVSGNNNLASWVRKNLVPPLLPRLLGSKWLRSKAFGFASELRIHYRESPAVAEGRPRLHFGPRAGERLFDAPLRRDGHAVWLQHTVVGPHLSLLLCGDHHAFDTAALTELQSLHAGLLQVHHLTRQSDAVGALHDDGSILNLLGARAGAQYLLRPDGYIAFRCAGYDLESTRQYLAAFTGRG